MKSCDFAKHYKILKNQERLQKRKTIIIQTRKVLKRVYDVKSWVNVNMFIRKFIRNILIFNCIFNCIRRLRHDSNTTSGVICRGLVPLTE